jgi:hypothetical protein
MGVQETLKARLSQPWTNNTGADLAGSGTKSPLTYPAQLAPSRRTQVAHDQSHIAISVKSVLVVGDTKITDLLCGPAVRY